jgi:predicted protein tyrosine phosphatase
MALQETFMPSPNERSERSAARPAGDGSAVIVAGYALARQYAAAIDPFYIISLMDPGSAIEIAGGTNLRDHIRIFIHDIAEAAQPGSTDIAPGREHVAQVVDFAQAWDGDGPVLIHCAAGVSRSAAAGLILLAARHPGREREIAQTMRRRGPWVAPNRRMVQLADDLLLRGGALLAARDGMGTPEVFGMPAEMLRLPGRFAE